MKTLFRNARFFRESLLQDFLVEKGHIKALGPCLQAPPETSILDLKGVLTLPGFVECHTHTVFAGNRGREMEMKFQGRSYQDIAAAGGGILSTVQATRKASHETLRTLSQERIQKFIAQGVTTLEIKSGYGLDLETEIKMLESLPEHTGIDVVKTFLGAHARPPEFQSHDKYLEFLGNQVLPEIKKKNLASRVDIFVEKGFFEAGASRRYLEKAQSLGFQITVHADQLSCSGGSELACQVGALSADHCIEVGDREIELLAKSKIVAVLLPAADFYLKCPYPPARKMLDAGVRVALATDFNPGTSPTQDVFFVGVLARREMKMTLEEVLRAYTLGAAEALGLEKELGSLEVGKWADFTLWDIQEEELFQSVGGSQPRAVFKKGKKIFERESNSLHNEI